MTLTIAAISLRETSRRPVALLFVFLLPLVFYVVRLDVHWQAIRFLAIGVGWAIATLSLFSHVGTRRLSERLTVMGASPTALFLGRQLALAGAGLAVAGVYFAVVALTLDVPRLPAVALLLGTTALTAVPLGALVSLVVPRELEGALALLTLMALQLLADPADAFTKALPMWSTRELAGYAIESAAGNRLHQGLLHFAGTLALCWAAAWGANHLRLRPVRLPEPATH